MGDCTKQKSVYLSLITDFNSIDPPLQQQQQQQQQHGLLAIDMRKRKKKEILFPF